MIKAIKKGEKSSFVEKFNQESFLKGLHKKHLGKE